MSEVKWKYQRIGVVEVWARDRDRSRTIAMLEKKNIEADLRFENP